LKYLDELNENLKSYQPLRFRIFKTCIIGSMAGKQPLWLFQCLQGD
jgi:hypothetical protein